MAKINTFCQFFFLTFFFCNTLLRNSDWIVRSTMNVYLANAEVRPELEKIPTIPESSNGYMVPRKQKCWYGQGHSGPRGVKLVHCELFIFWNELHVPITLWYYRRFSISMRNVYPVIGFHKTRPLWKRSLFPSCSRDVSW